MAHWRTMIEKDHLGAWDMVDRDGKTPRDYTLKIATATSKLLKTREQPKGKRKLVITFTGARKAFVVNTTNAEVIESLYGGDVDGWVGKLITLYQTDVRNPKGGGQIKGIRVRPKVPQGKGPEVVPEREPDPEMTKANDEAFGREPGSDDV